jgi:prophage tail gpP-like protein
VSTGQGNGATEVTVAGRDWQSILTRRYIRFEKHFGTPTYFELTRQVLDLCGLKDRKLYGDNEANRRNSTRSVTAKSDQNGRIKVENEETNAVTPSGTKVVYQRIVAKVGQTWFDFLKTQYKQVGLYLWTTPDGNFVLARPTAKQRPLYMLRHGRGIQRDETNVISVAYQNRTSGRHAYVRVIGRVGQGEKGRGEVSGETNDHEMIAFGFDDEIVIHDHDCKTPRACEFMAFRTIAEERRANCCLTVTVSGHTTPSLLDRGKMVVWAPDTVVSIFSAELGIGDETSGTDYYIEEVTFSRSPHTTTTLKLMRKGDVSFLGESDVDEARFAQDATQHKRNVDVVAGSANQIPI